MDAHSQFLNDQQRRRDKLAFQAKCLGKYLTCARCGWCDTEESCRSQGLNACPNCGSRQCRVTCLPYSLGGAADAKNG